MTHPGIFAILVGVAIGTAIYYYFNSDNLQQPYQQHSSGIPQEPPPPRFTPKRIKRSDSTKRNPSLRRRQSGEKCIICFDVITCEPADNYMMLNNCGHEFHSHCIVKWLKEKKECPVCRTPVM